MVKNVCKLYLISLSTYIINVIQFHFNISFHIKTVELLFKIRNIRFSQQTKYLVKFKPRPQRKNLATPITNVTIYEQVSKNQISCILFPCNSKCFHLLGVLLKIYLHVTMWENYICLI